MGDVIVFIDDDIIFVFIWLVEGWCIMIMFECVGGVDGSVLFDVVIGVVCMLLFICFIDYECDVSGFICVEFVIVNCFVWCMMFECIGGFDECFWLVWCEDFDL